jgi:hypothetical protein
VQKLKAALPAMLRDAAGILGAALVAFGFWRIYQPAGFIVAGVLLVTASFLLARAE